MRYVAQRLGLLLVFAGILFGAAGRLCWPRGWACVSAVFLLEAASLTVLALRAPDTLRRRGIVGAGIAPFDRVFAVLWLGLGLATPIVAGLDAVRFHASALPGWLFAVGFGALTAATALGTWAMVENEHFEQFVRIQSERRHRVVTTGPYRVVRHPGYLAAIAGALALPLLLGSAWTFLPAVLVAALFGLRTQLEDRFLARELAGYAEYAQRTRFRLVPGVW